MILANYINKVIEGVNSKLFSVAEEQSLLRYQGIRERLRECTESAIFVNSFLKFLIFNKY